MFKLAFTDIRETKLMIRFMAVLSLGFAGLILCGFGIFPTAAHPLFSLVQGKSGGWLVGLERLVEALAPFLIILLWYVLRYFYLLARERSLSLFQVMVTKNPVRQNNS